MSITWRTRKKLRYDICEQWYWVFYILMSSIWLSNLLNNAGRFLQPEDLKFLEYHHKLDKNCTFLCFALFFKNEQIYLKWDMKSCKTFGQTTSVTPNLYCWFWVGVHAKNLIIMHFLTDYFSYCFDWSWRVNPRTFAATFFFDEISIIILAVVLNEPCANHLTDSVFRTY